MRRLYQLLAIFVCVLTMYAAVLPAQAYTEEEKQAAKSWLSANGYPPTMGGAQQAYQDYLNGKFDSNGNRITQTEPQTETEEPVTDKPDSSGREKPSTGKDRKPDDSSGGDDGDDTKKSANGSENGTNGSGGAGESEFSMQPNFIKMLAEFDTGEFETEIDNVSKGETESTETASDETAASTDSDLASGDGRETVKPRNSVKKASVFTETVPLILGPVLVILIGGVLLAVKWKKR